jgi:hypothetical protein
MSALWMIALAASTCSISPVEAQTEKKTYSVCIGDICKGIGDFNNTSGLDCGFAHAHSSDTDEQAAKYVCTILLNGFTHFTPQRINTIGGGNCGAIYLQVTCEK